MSFDFIGHDRYIIDHTNMVIAYGVILALFALYSFSLLDLNLTLLNIDVWTQFRNVMIQFGYFHRFQSTVVYLALLCLLIGFHYFFVKRWKKFSAIQLSIIIAGISIFAYPFLSYDLFNYMFDAKILTFYHQNPYLHRAMDFQSAPELRFMHWVHRTYPYGPTFLPLTLVPSFLGLGKFSLTFLTFKIFFAAFYLLAVRALNKMNSQWAIFFATHPLVIIEGLVNNHNDLIAVALGLIGVQMLWSKHLVLGKLFFLISGGIKYVTLPLIALQKKASTINVISFCSVCMLLMYLSIFQEVQTWYFLSLFVFIPYFFELIKRMQIFLIGILFSYYPFLLYGTWGDINNIRLKHEVIILFATINLVVLIVQRKSVIRHK